MIPPEHNAEFAAAMEHVLEVYETPHDPEVPVAATNCKAGSFKLRKTRSAGGIMM